MIWFLPWQSDESASRHHPWATWTLMAINVIAYLLRPDVGPAEMHAWYLEWGLTAGDWHWYQFVTSAVMHGSWMHLLGNMFFLWLLGDGVEDALGVAGFLGVYLLGGLVGDFLYVSANSHMVPSIGASGCIAAVAGAYAMMFFSRTVPVKVMLLVFPVYTLNLPALLVLLGWFAVDIALTLGGGGAIAGEGGTNYVAHGAGFLFGAGVGLAAAMHGTMQRYADLPNGDAWFGYFPARLEEEHRRAMLRRVRQEHFL